jgi:N-acetylglutamate synthase-like GNAT family acetyltransferase
LSEADAEARLGAQPPLQEKLAAATVVIDNDDTIEATRVQVVRAFASIRPENASDKMQMLAALLGLKPSAPAPAAPPEPPSAPPPSKPVTPALPRGEARRRELQETAGPSPSPVAPQPTPEMQVAVRRARPADIGVLSSLLAQAEGSAQPLARAETLRRFGKWGYWLVEADGQAVALAAWRAENLVALMRDLWAPSADLATRIFPPLFGAIEQEAQALQCEAVTVLTNPANDVLAHAALAASGYSPGKIDALHKHWRGVVRDELREGETLYFKRLRTEMVTKPI